MDSKVVPAEIFFKEMARLKAKGTLPIMHSIRSTHSWVYYYSKGVVVGSAYREMGFPIKYSLIHPQ